MRGKGERTEPVARHSSRQGWVQEELALTCPASFPFRAKAGEENSPRDQTMSHRPRSRGCRHTGGGCPGPLAPARPRRRKKEGERLHRVLARPHTYPRRGKVPAPASRLRPSSRQAPEPPRASARLRAGRGRKGKRDGKRSRAVAQSLLPLGRAAPEPCGRREGRVGSLRQWRRPGPEGKRNNRRRCAWPQPWGRATAGSGEGRSQDTSPPGPKPGAPRGGDRHRFPMGGLAWGLLGVVV